MTLRDYTANVISASKVVPDGNFKDSKASGVWDINEALDLIKGGNWPNAANFNPAAFIDNLFKTHLYTGNGSTQSITTGIDLSSSNEGLVWLKDRGATNNHALYDTVRGATYGLEGSNSASTSAVESNGLTAFTSTGFSLGNRSVTNNNTNSYVSWTWRKAPRFFDVVTYTGTGSAQAIAHSLGSVPGMIITKGLDTAYNWGVFHRSVGNTKALILDVDNAENTGSSFWNNTDPTSTHFTVGSDNTTNANGENYVAYLFAHNNNDGGFGEPGDQDIIKCGSYTGNTSGTEVNLGFEPQFVMIKKSSASESWYVYDSMRGVVTGGANSQDKKLRWNSNGAEGAVASPIIAFSANGFILESTDNEINGSGTYVYMAIRRGGMQTPTTGTDVFAIDARTGSTPEYVSGFPVDFALVKDSNSSSDWIVNTRLMGDKFQETNTTEPEADDSLAKFDIQNGIRSDAVAGDYGWMWKRARGYFDVVTYTGSLGASNFSGTTSINHNLGVTPEMIWIKSRSDTPKWCVGSTHFSSGGTLALNENAALEAVGGTTRFVYADWSSTVFKVGNSDEVNRSGYTYVAYLFATVAGVSKVGSYTANGSAQNIDCGFSGGNGARFVFIKRTDNNGHWFLFDTARGLVSGNDPNLQLNETNAQETTYDHIDPLEAGFTVAVYGDDSPYVNINGATYLFYAIA